MAIDSDLFCCWPLHVLNKENINNLKDHWIRTQVLSIVDYILLFWDVLWCPVFQVKTLLASHYVFMPVRLLDSSSPVDSTLRGITSGRTGTPDRRPPCLVRLLIYTTGSLKMISQDYLITFNHYFSTIAPKVQTTETVQLKVLFFSCLLQSGANLPLHITTALSWGIYCPGLTSSFFLLSAPSAQRLPMGWPCSKSGCAKESSTRSEACKWLFFYSSFNIVFIY